MNLAGQKLLLPFYHMVSDDRDSFAKYLYPPRKVEVFKRDLECLLKYYEPVDLLCLIEHAQNKKLFQKPVFHLTFDDGLSNFYEVVAPILEAKGVPSTFFVNTDFVDNKDLFYRYKASLLIQKLEDQKAKYSAVIKSCFQEHQSFKDQLLKVDYAGAPWLDDLANKMGFSFNAFLQDEKPYLSKIQIKSLIKRGFTIGAHSKNHPLYAEIPIQEQYLQTEESISYIQKHFNVSYRAFSFPFSDVGVGKQFFEKMSTKLDISFGTSDQKEDEVSNNFQRISFELADDNIARFLNRSNSKFLLRRLLSRHKIIRS